MADLVAVTAGIVSGVAGLAGGGGLVGLLQVLRQGRRERLEDTERTFDKRIELADKLGDSGKANEIRREYAQYLEGRQAQQGLTNIFSAKISAAESEPKLSEKQAAEVADSLEKAQTLKPAFLSASDYTVQANAFYSLGRYEEALVAYEQARRLEPTNQDVLLGRAAALGKWMEERGLINRPQSTRSSDEAVVRIGSASISQDEMASVGLEIVSHTKRIGAYTVDVVFDESKIAPIACSPKGGGVCNPRFARNIARITGASAIGAVGEVQLGTLEFKGRRRGASPLQLRVVVLADTTMGNPQNVPFVLEHGSITVL